MSQNTMSKKIRRIQKKPTKTCRKKSENGKGAKKISAVFDDGILTKNNHRVILMMEKIKKHITASTEDAVLNIEKKDIEQYLSEMKEAVGNNRYRLDRNAKRQDNINLFLNYVIDEARVKEIILSLTVMDFSDILQNEHKGFEHERLYVFGKDVTLLESISLYQIQQAGELFCDCDFVP